MKIVIKLVSGFLLMAFLIGSLSIFGVHIINHDIVEIVERENPKVQAALELEINIQEMAHAIYVYNQNNNQNNSTQQTIISFRDARNDFAHFLNIYKTNIRTTEEEELITSLAKMYKSMSLLGDEIISGKNRINLERDKVSLLLKSIQNSLENKLNKSAKNSGKDVFSKLTSSSRMHLAAEKIISPVEIYITRPSSILIGKIEAAEKSFSSELKKYKRFSLSSNEKRVLSSIQSQYNSMKDSLDKLILLEEQQQEHITIFNTILRASDDLLDNQIQLIAMQEIADDERRALFNTTMVIGSILIAIILSPIVGYLISLPITNPIINLRNATNRIGEGDLDTVIDVNSRDEVGELAASYNIMLQKLKASKENLEQKVELKTRELNDKLEELERFNKLAVGRELKMIELKKDKAMLEETNNKHLAQLAEKNEEIEKLEKLLMQNDISIQEMRARLSNSNEEQISNNENI